MPLNPQNPSESGADRRPAEKERQSQVPKGTERRPAAPKAPGSPVRKQNPNPPAGGRPRRPGTGSLRPAAAKEGSRLTRRPQEGTRRVPSQKPGASSKSTPAHGYQPKFAAKNQKKRPEFSLNPRTLMLIALLVIGTITLIGMCVSLVGGHEDVEIRETYPEAVPMETAAPEIPTLVSEAKISVTGDLLPHKTIYSKGSVIFKDDQDYDFSPIFKYLTGYTDTADYAVANLETSLFGPGKPYSGNPKFNTPDQIVDGAKGAGFDMLLTANNHCNDTGIEGVLRTVEIIRSRGLRALGSNLEDSEQKYHIEELNGIKVGMLCYTYEDSQNPDQVTFNYNPLPKDKSSLVCSFPKFTNAKSREPFYEEISGLMTEMRSKGADVIVLFLHWGEEYHLEASADQREMAQRLCDLGVDVIVGGHPHVVEPVELISSSGENSHKTVCLYSLGNAFSNQRREEMTTQKSGHTEDGMLFNMNFSKYSDGSVYLSSVEVIPTWVNKHADPEGKREYNILPLEQSKSDQWQTLFHLDEGSYLQAADSYSRTMNIVGAGLETSNSWLASRLPREAPEEAETQQPSES